MIDRKNSLLKVYSYALFSARNFFEVTNWGYATMISEVIKVVDRKEGIPIQLLCFSC